MYKNRDSSGISREKKNLRKAVYEVRGRIKTKDKIQDIDY